MRWLPLIVLIALLPQDSPKPDSHVENSRLNEHLKFFEPYVGKTYRGEFANSNPERPMGKKMRGTEKFGQPQLIPRRIYDGQSS